MQDLNILYVDDDTQIIEIVVQYLSREGYAVTAAGNGPDALSQIKRSHFDVVFSDLMMPEMDGLDLLKKIKSRSPDTEVIIVTGFGTIETAIKALKLGGYDYLQKPIKFERMKILLERISEKKQLERENTFIKERLKERYKYDEIVGISPKMQDIYAIIDKISMGSPTVLVQGESGTGKELCATVIHKNSTRKDGPFIAVNCGAISENLLESELFGHVKGAFTGAIKDAIGLFKAADGGTLFLDEIAEIPPSVQVKLLRVLQEKKIRPVGEFKETEVDVRVIAATNKDLKQAIKNGTFRKDLFYRLNVISLEMPPLREIKEDIPFLIAHFMKKYENDNMSGKRTLAQSTRDILTNYHWPGNVRELENAIERAYALAGNAVIQPDDLPPEIASSGNALRKKEINFNLRENEIALIKRALSAADGNKAKAAEFLGINLSTVYRKIEKYRIVD